MVVLPWFADEHSETRSGLKGGAGTMFTYVEISHLGIFSAQALLRPQRSFHEPLVETLDVSTRGRDERRFGVVVLRLENTSRYLLENILRD
jgi:hypothetical protein